MLSKRRTIRAVVTAEQAGLRLDQFLAQIDQDLSRGQAKKLIDLGSVHLNQRRLMQCSRELRTNDAITVHIDGLPFEPFVLKDQDIIFRDQYLLLVNKPAGVDTQPTPSRYKGTLYAAVADYLKNPLRRDLKPSIGMVQRLDRDTSGLIIFSIHRQAHKGLTQAFAGRGVRKLYRAFVSGRIEPAAGEFKSMLARNRASNLMRSVARGGQEALTRYRTIAANELMSAVEVEIPTGRMHQIRVHFAEAGHPLLGDTRYGGPAAVGNVDIPRQMLHACSLQLLHPVSKVKLDFSLDLPYDMNAVFRKLSGD